MLVGLLRCTVQCNADDAIFNLRAHYSFMHHILELQEDRKPLPNGDMPVTIKVIGVGGAGGNAINGMVSTTKNLQGVEFIAMVSTLHLLL
jgi:hypothetical protein